MAQLHLLFTKFASPVAVFFLKLFPTRKAKEYTSYFSLYYIKNWFIDGNKQIAKPTSELASLANNMQPWYRKYAKEQHFSAGINKLRKSPQGWFMHTLKWKCNGTPKLARYSLVYLWITNNNKRKKIEVVIEKLPQSSYQPI